MLDGSSSFDAQIWPVVGLDSPPAVLVSLSSMLGENLLHVKMCFALSRVKSCDLYYNDKDFPIIPIACYAFRLLLVMSA